MEMTVTLQSIATCVPDHVYSTEELLHVGGDRLSADLRGMVGRFGVAQRHSIYANYPQILFGGAAPQQTTSATRMGVDAVRRCLADASCAATEVGLLIAFTQTPSRLVPGLAPDMMALLPELPRDIAHLSLQGQGCSTLLKAVDTARWFLHMNPDKRVLIVSVEAISALSPPLTEGRYGSFREATSQAATQQTVDAIHGFLFGDGAVALLLGADGAGPVFGPTAHLTNVIPEDANLGRLEGGGSDEPVLNGRPRYRLEPLVPERGAVYAQETMRQVLGAPQSPIATASEAAKVLIHTGSRKILESICGLFALDADAPQVASCFRVLARYGNLSSAAIGFMLADALPAAKGSILMSIFGMSFSASAGILTAA